MAILLRSPRSLQLIVAGLVSLALVDAGTTWIGLRQGHIESNGLIKTMMDALTVEGALGFRVLATVAYGAWVLWLAGRYRDRIVRGAAYAICVPVAIGWSLAVVSNMSVITG